MQENTPFFFSLSLSLVLSYFSSLSTPQMKHFLLEVNEYTFFQYVLKIHIGKAAKKVIYCNSTLLL